MLRSLSIFLLGLILGGACFAVWPRVTTDATPLASPDTSTAPAAFAFPAWSWRERETPPPLPPASVDRAITAWLALREPAGGSVNFAHRAETLQALLAYLPTRAYPRLLDAVLAHPTPNDRLLLDIVYQRYAELDPASAAQWVVTAKTGPDFSPFNFAKLAIAHWVKKDPNTVAAWLKAMENRAFATGLSTQMLSELAKVDPAAALRTFGPDLWNNGKNVWSLRPALTLWAQRDPAAMLAWVLAQPRKNDRQLGWWIGEISAGANPQALLAIIIAQPSLPARESTMRQVLEKWSLKEPAAALAWAQSIPDRHQRNELLEQLSYQDTDGNHKQILSFALALPEGKNRIERIGDLLGNWAGRDPTSTLAWIRDQKDPAVAAAAPAAQAAILGAIARDEPQTAIAEWQALADEKTKREAISLIIKSWSETDPGAALRWLETQPNVLATSGLAGHYAHQALYPWSLKEPEAALRWAEAQPQQKAYYLQGLSGDLRNKADRATVSDLYTKITDPTLRTEVLTAHVREWLTKDRPAAQAWLESNSTLTAEQAAALLAPPPAR